MTRVAEASAWHIEGWNLWPGLWCHEWVTWALCLIYLECHVCTRNNAKKTTNPGGTSNEMWCIVVTVAFLGTLNVKLLYIGSSRLNYGASYLKGKHSWVRDFHAMFDRVDDLWDGVHRCQFAVTQNCSDSKWECSMLSIRRSEAYWVFIWGRLDCNFSDNNGVFMTSEMRFWPFLSNGKNNLNGCILLC